MKKKIFIVFLTVFVLAGCKQKENVCEEHFKKTGSNYQKLNLAGYDHYKNREYEKAAGFFRCSVQQNPDYAVSAYNLACTLSLMHGQGKNVDPEEIFINLKKAASLSNKYKAKMKTDPDLVSVRDMPGFVRISQEACNTDDVLASGTYLGKRLAVSYNEESEFAVIVGHEGTDYTMTIHAEPNVGTILYGAMQNCRKQNGGFAVDVAGEDMDPVKVTVIKNPDGQYRFQLEEKGMTSENPLKSFIKDLNSDTFIKK